jgi:predicted phosphodiesterase
MGVHLAARLVGRRGDPWRPGRVLFLAAPILALGAALALAADPAPPPDEFKPFVVFTLNNCDFVCLNSNRMEGSSGQSKKAKAQMEWFEKALRDSREHNRTHTFVVMHHPVANDEPIRGLLVKYGVKVVLAGHLHKTEEIRGKGLVTYVAPGTARFRDEGGLGYRVFKVYKDRVEQEFVPLEKEVGEAKLAP